MCCAVISQNFSTGNALHLLLSKWNASTLIRRHFTAVKVTDDLSLQSMAVGWNGSQNSWTLLSFPRKCNFSVTRYPLSGSVSKVGSPDHLLTSWNIVLLDSHSDNQEVHRLLRNPMVHYLKSQLEPVLNQLNPVVKSNLSSTPRSPKWSLPFRFSD